MAQKMRLLLPAADSGKPTPGTSFGATSSAINIIPRRATILSACDFCRLKKWKCNGQRPKCQKCIDQGTQCIYQTNQGETQTAALKRKYGQVEIEVNQYRQLLEYVQKRPADEAQEIFKRLRSSLEPLEVLQAIKDADLLLARSLSREGRIFNSPTSRLEEEALAKAEIKVPAQPWTSLVGDGMMSGLITDFFDSDHLFSFPPIDREAFLEDMRAANAQTAKYCSPLLVNAICAHRSFRTRRESILGFLMQENLAARFLQESKRLLDLENGRSSLPTVIALYYLYATLTILGKDRPGNIYRYMTVDMLKSLNLPKRFSRLRDDTTESTTEKRVISKALWGLFLFESRACCLYRRRSLIHPPSVPRLFDDKWQGDDHNVQQNCDILGQPYAADSTLLAQTPGILHAMCDLTEIFYEVIAHNCQAKPTLEAGGADDLSTRTRMYAALETWRRELPDMFGVERNFTRQTCWLRSHANETALNILLRLEPDVMLPEQNQTVKELCLWHCRDEIDIGQRFMKVWSADGLLGRAQFVILSTMTPLLRDESVHASFTASAHLLRYTVRDCPVFSIMLTAVQALAWSLKQDIPIQALQYFDGPQADGDVVDLPVSFQLPNFLDLHALELDEADMPEEPVNEISTLIAEWSALNIKP